MDDQNVKSKKKKKGFVDDSDDPLKKHYRYGKLEKVFARLDIGGNGAISFAEYLTTIDRLTPDEVEAARSAFEILGPDRNGNVQKKKFIAMQIEAFEDVLDAEFDRYVHIMTQGSLIHPHTRKALMAAGVEIPEDFIDPPQVTVVGIVMKHMSEIFDRVYRVVFARSVRRRIAAYELSANARMAHIYRIQKLKQKLEEHDKTLLDEEHAQAITALQEKAKLRGTQVPSVQRKPHRVEKTKKINNREKLAKQARPSFGDEEKENDEAMIRGRKQGNEFPPLPFESSDVRLRAAREAEKKRHHDRHARDLVGNLEETLNINQIDAEESFKAPRMHFAQPETHQEQEEPLD